MGKQTRSIAQQVMVTFLYTVKHHSPTFVSKCNQRDMFYDVVFYKQITAFGYLFFATQR